MSTLCWLALDERVQMVLQLLRAFGHFLQLVKIVDLRLDKGVAVNNGFLVVTVDVLIAFTPCRCVEISLLLPIAGVLVLKESHRVKPMLLGRILNSNTQVTSKDNILLKLVPMLLRLRFLGAPQLHVVMLD